MATAPVEGLYPFSTQDGQAVPLEIVRPSTLTFWNLVKNTEQTIALTSDFIACYAYATCNLLLRNEDTTFGALAAATAYSKTILIPSDTPIVLSLRTGNSRLYPLADGVLYLSAVSQWAAIKQDLQTRIG